MIPLKDDIPTRRFPFLTVALIAINVGMFLFFQGAFLDSEREFNQTVAEYGAIPYEISHPGRQCALADGGQVICEGQEGVRGQAPEDLAPTWLTLLTSMFMHGGLLHIGFNMLFLWIFGNNIEDSMGRLRFVGFYLIGGLVALGLQTLVEPDAAVPTIGASGAVAAVLGGYALLYPRARVVTLVLIVIFFTVIRLPALIVLGAWILLQLAAGAADLASPVGEGDAGGVAYFAHIGGFVFGLLAIKLFANRVHEDYTQARRSPVLG
ncbi:MAG: rhomboid family intramembrane serine protease [Thermoleophilaceae bacterium]